MNVCCFWKHFHAWQDIDRTVGDNITQQLEEDYHDIIIHQIHHYWYQVENPTVPNISLTATVLERRKTHYAFVSNYTRVYPTITEKSFYSNPSKPDIHNTGKVQREKDPRKFSMGG